MARIRLNQTNGLNDTLRVIERQTEVQLRASVQNNLADMPRFFLRVVDVEKITSQLQNIESDQLRGAMQRIAGIRHAIADLAEYLDEQMLPPKHDETPCGDGVTRKNFTVQEESDLIAWAKDLAPNIRIK